MPRKPKWRRVAFLPNLTFFKPAGVPLKKLKEEHIQVEELEAIRLKDLEGLEQEACARKMGVSRPTFQRIIAAARQKITQALVEGKAIRIEGGNYRLHGEHRGCPKCRPAHSSPQKRAQLPDQEDSCSHCVRENENNPAY